MNKIKNILRIKIFAIVIFLLAVSVWYSPVIFKGYAPKTLSGDFSMARNYNLTGIFGAESELNVVLSSQLVKEQAHASSGGNRLTGLIYAKIFKFLGPLGENEAVILSLAINALTLVIFSLLVLYLFSWISSLIFSLIYILLPFFWQTPYNIGSYEFSLLFFSLFFLFFLLGKERKYKYIYLGSSGLFLALAVTAKEALLLFLPFFFLYLLIKKQKKYILAVFIPLVVLFTSFWLPNDYLLMFSNRTSETSEFTDFARYGHLFPDPYTYHFERENFIKNYQNQLESKETDPLIKEGLINYGSTVGIRNPSLFERIKGGIPLFLTHFSRFLSLEEVGGPFVFLLMLLGLYCLRNKNRYLADFAWSWILSILLILSFLLAERSHLVDFGWILALLIALGLVALSKIISQYFNFTIKWQNLLLFLLVSAAVYNFLLVNHVAWNRVFEEHETDLLIKSYSQKIREYNILPEEVISTPLDISPVYYLNYVNDKSLAVFREETIENLLAENKLDKAFKEFKVAYILGYPDELSREMVEQTKVVNIAANSLKPADIERKTPLRGWFLNLVR